MAKVIGINQAKRQDQTIYDPTCGSGSLLLKAADEAQFGVTIYGQEMDNATAALAKMNMILHNNPTAEIWQDNTLSKPYFKHEDGTLKTFDFAVANPPFSTKAWSNGFDPANDLYERFHGYGMPPAKNGDYAFLLHLIRSLRSKKGKGAIILPHGVLFRGNAEAEIRKQLIRKGFIKGIIGLPANLFYGTGIPACIIVLDKENAESRKGIFMIDASKGFVKDGNKNRLREQDVHKIVDVFTKQLTIPYYSRMVSIDEIEQNEYNLNIPRYIDSQEVEDMQDIEAHLLGDIPERDINNLADYWNVFPTLKNSLFASSSRTGYSKLKISSEEIKQKIFTHPEFESYIQAVEMVFARWKQRSTAMLKQLSQGVKPKEVIHHLAEDMLESFSNVQLIDHYDIYQHLMTYWLETMQDDLYLIASDGWKAEPVVVNEKKQEWDCDLLPKDLVINRYFVVEQSAIDQLETAKEEILREKEELEEEHAGEDGLLEEVKSDKGKISKASIQKRIKEIKHDADAADELAVLQVYAALIEQESEANKQLKQARKLMDEQVFTKYGELSEAEIKTLVVDDKWMVTLQNAVQSELDRISQRLAKGVKELAERYATPLSALQGEVEDLTEKVEAHLQRMGFVW
jgi:type I restriction enzyme M protein